MDMDSLQLISSLTNLTCLDIWLQDAILSSLSGIEKLVNLTKFGLTTRVDIQPLSALYNLEIL